MVSSSSENNTRNHFVVAANFTQKYIQYAYSEYGSPFLGQGTREYNRISIWNAASNQYDQMNYTNNIPLNISLYGDLDTRYFRGEKTDGTYVYWSITWKGLTDIVNFQPGTGISAYIQTTSGPTTEDIPASFADASLENLVPSVGNLSPIFNQNTLSYIVSVSNQAAIELTPTTSATTASVTVNGVSVASGSTSSSIPLNVGSNPIAVVVTSPDGSVIETYTVDVIREIDTLQEPTNLSAIANNGSATISFDQPSDAIGGQVTNYKYQLNGGNWIALSPVTTSSPITIPNLTNGTTYSIKLLALNDAGDGLASSAVEVTPATTANQPTTLTANSRDGSAEISFTTPSDNGGSEIINYEYQVDGGDWVAFSPDVTTSPVTVTGLTNGTSHSIKLRAVNGVGSGTESDSVQVVPAATPDAPTILQIVAGNETAGVSFTAPVNPGGSTISDYEYQLDGGDWVSVGDTSSSFTITGLINGQTYSVKIRAVNGSGGGLESNTVLTRPVTTPSLPTNVSYTPGNGVVEVSFTSPVSDGGSPITDYEYDLGDGSGWQSAGVTTSPFTISSLSNGTQYSIKIRAKSAVGYSDATSSIEITPATTPDAPTNLQVTPGNSSVEISFTPGFNGGSAITDYEYELDGSGNWVSLGDNTSPVTLTGLENGASYSVRIRAVNSAGSGAPSASVTAEPGSPASEFERAKEDVKQAVTELANLNLRNSLTSNSMLMRDARERFILDNQASSRGLSSGDELPDLFVNGGGTLEAFNVDTSIARSESLDTNTRRVFRGNLVATKVQGGSTSLHGSIRLATERRVSEDNLLAYFLGADFGQDKIDSTFKGDQDSFAIGLGGYTINRLDDNLYFDGSAGIEVRRNDLKMSNDILQLTSDYETVTGILSAALTGIYAVTDKIQLWPEMSITYGKTFMGDIKFTGTAYGLSDSNLILKAGTTSIGLLTFAPELRVPFDGLSVAKSASVMNVAPRWVCELIQATEDTNDCGYGIQVRYKKTWDEASKVFNMGVISDRVGNVTSTTLSLEVKAYF